MSNGYTPFAILFDGVTPDFMLRGDILTGIADSKIGTVSSWVRLDGGDGFGREIFGSFGASVSKFHFALTSSNKFTVEGIAGAPAVHLETVLAYLAGPTWLHVMASWDLVAGATFFYVNDVSDKFVISDNNTAVVYSDQTEWFFGADQIGDTPFMGALADPYFTTEFLDLSIEVNRRKFIDANGDPVYLGDNGELPTGTPALVYLRGNTSNQGANSGTGGNYASQATQIPGETPGPIVLPVESPLSPSYIKTTVGKGTTGVLADLKDFVRLADATNTRKDTVVTLKPVKVIINWSVFQGDAYIAETVTEYDDMRLDIVGVKTSLDSGLVRVETLQICIDTPGTYFYVVDEEFQGSQARWDDGSSWDTLAPNSPVWDQFNALYIHLFGGTNPNLQTIVAQYGIYLSNREMIIPELGPDKLVNGDFENWTPDYDTNAILFDGSTDFMLRGGDLTGIVNSKLGTLSVWFRIDGADSTERYIIGNELTRFSLRITFENELIINARNTSGSSILRWAHTPNLQSGPHYFHYVSSWDLGLFTIFSFLDDVADGDGFVGNENIDYTDTDWIIGAKNVVGDNKFHGALGELYFTTEFIDISIEANRRKFITADKGPVPLGVTGQLPTGTSALLYLLGDLTDQGINSGTGGDFVSQGVQIPGETLGPVVETADGWTSSDSELASKESIIVKFNNFSLRHEVSVAEPVVFTQQQLTGFIIGQVYRLAGYYQSSVNAQASLLIFDSLNNSYLPDGRNTVNVSDPADLADGNGLINIGSPTTKNRTFLFDFRAFATTLNFMLLTQYTGSGTAPVFFYWDGMSIKRIWRFTNCDPRLSVSSVPSVKTGSNDIFFGGKSIGSGSIGVINSDGQFERLIADFEWMNQEAIVQTGGAFSDGQEIPFNDYRHSMSGLIQRIDVDDFEAKFDLQDVRAFFHRVLPSHLYTETDDGSGNDFFINMDLSRIGLSHPIFFGFKEHIDPVRIDKTTDGVTDLGIYEICDTTNSPDGMKAIDKVFVYGDIVDAAVKNPARRFELGLGISYSEDLAAGTITILQDIVPILVEVGNNTFSFNDGGGVDHDVVVPSGLYSTSGIANAVTDAMLAAGGETDTICIYDATTGLWTISRPSGSLDLFFSSKNTSNDVPSDFPKLLNYDLKDKTGALSYSSDDVRDVDIDRDVQLRVDAQGYKDDSSGTFTGTPDALIEIGADILRTLLIQFMGKAPSVIDETSFVAARQLSGESLSVFLNAPISTKDIFDTLEFSNISNIVVNGEGKVFYKVYTGQVPANIKTLDDAQIKNWSVERSVTGIYAGIRVKYDKSPTGMFKQRQADDNSVPVRLGRPEIREFETFLKSGSNAISTANRMLELARSAARKVSTRAVGGNFVDLEVGDKIIINRERALSVGGKIRNEIFRIISIGKQQQEGIVDMDLTDDRVTVASDDCDSSNCQQHCEGTCQETDQCTVSCQETCQQPNGGQESCEVNCQDGCQRSCESCQGAGCQSVAENPPLCDIGCEVSCQACEGAGCQTSCESSGCEASCQDCQTVKQLECQSSCQNACELGGCEQGCQNCQNACETGATCESGCQTGSCENTCQTTGCEGSCQNCQNSCQTSACQVVEELI